MASKKPSLKDNKLILSGVLATVFLFSTTAIPQGIWVSSGPVIAQMDSGNQTATLDQLVSNLSQAKEAVGSGNSTAVTMQLTVIIGRSLTYLAK